MPPPPHLRVDLARRESRPLLLRNDVAETGHRQEGRWEGPDQCPRGGVLTSGQGVQGPAARAGSGHGRGLATRGHDQAARRPCRHRRCTCRSQPNRARGLNADGHPVHGCFAWLCAWLCAHRPGRWLQQRSADPALCDREHERLSVAELGMAAAQPERAPLRFGRGA